MLNRISFLLSLSSTLFSIPKKKVGNSRYTKIGFKKFGRKSLPPEPGVFHN